MFKKDDSQTTLNDPKFTPSAKGNGEGSEPDTTDQAQLPPPDHEEFIKDFEELVNSIAQKIYEGNLSPQFSAKFDEFSEEIRESIESNGASMEELIKQARKTESSLGTLTSKTKHITKRFTAEIAAAESKLREELEQQHLATKGELTKEIGEVEGRTTQRLVVIKKEAAKGLAELEKEANSRFNETSLYLTKLAEQVNRHGSAHAGFANKAREEFVSHKRLLWTIIAVQTLTIAALAVYWFIFR